MEGLLVSKEFRFLSALRPGLGVDRPGLALPLSGESRLCRSLWTMHMPPTTPNRTKARADQPQAAGFEAWLGIAQGNFELGAARRLHRKAQPQSDSVALRMGTMKAPAPPLGFGLGWNGLEDARLGNGALSGRRRGTRSDVGTSLSGSTVKETCTVRGMGIPGCWLHLSDEAALVAFGIARGSTTLRA